MDPRQLFTDTRIAQHCALCGIRPPATRDHVPARVFLDEPLPAHYPVVAVCERCNHGASKDEEYVACVIDAALHGTVMDTALLRPKVTAALTHSQPLAERLRQAEHRGGDGKCIGFACESARMRRVLEKVGRGLIAFEDGGAPVASDAEVTWSALGEITAEARSDFMNTPSQLLPEVGSRAMVRLARNGFDSPRPWTILQPGRFSYLVNRPLAGTLGVRMLFSDYLAAQCVFSA